MIDTEKFERLIENVKETKWLVRVAQDAFVEASEAMSLARKKEYEADCRMQAYILGVTGQQTENEESGDSGTNGEGQEIDPSGGE